MIHTTSTHLSLAAPVQTDLADWSVVVQRLRNDAVAPPPADVVALAEASELLPDWYDDWLTSCASAYASQGRPRHGRMTAA